MMIMPANHSSPTFHYLAGRYPNQLGWLIGPSARSKTKLRPWVPFALDNDAYTAWSKKIAWEVDEWLMLLQWVKRGGLAPLWVLVPDVVCDPEATLRSWHIHAPVAADFGWPLAFAVQDGMKPGDVPGDSNLIFVGGSTDWKWNSLGKWTSHFKRVHVGRVNELRRLKECKSFGVESVDGTGWFRDGQEGRRIPQLFQWLEEQSCL